jgi:hypothetical protein
MQTRRIRRVELARDNHRVDKSLVGDHGSRRPGRACPQPYACGPRATVPRTYRRRLAHYKWVVDTPARRATVQPVPAEAYFELLAVGGHTPLDAASFGPIRPRCAGGRRAIQWSCLQRGVTDSPRR